MGGDSRWANIPVKGQSHIPTPKLHPRSQVRGGGTAPAPSQKPNCLSGCLNQRTFPVQLCSVFMFTSQKPRGKKLCRLNL